MSVSSDPPTTRHDRNFEATRLFVEEAFFDLDACNRVRGAMDAGTIDPAEVITDDVIVDAAVRRTWSVEVDEATLTFVESALDAVRPRIAEFFGMSACVREGAGLLRYPAGGFYRPHVDRADVDGWPAAAQRRITLVAFLNHDFEGGDLRLVPDHESPRVIEPRAGMLVAFDAATLHEVAPVTAGIRDTIVDWLLES